MAERSLIVAEVAQAHDGSLGTAHAFIDLAAESGADVVKFQMHFAAEESTPQEPWRIKFSLQDECRYDYWKRMEFTPDQWEGLYEHCQKVGIQFLCSPFSVKAVEILKDFEMPAWKVASGEVFSNAMLDAMSQVDLPFWVSTGMIGWTDIQNVVQRISATGADLTLFQCTSAYPTPPEKVGLNVIKEMRQRFGCKVGLSDHTGKIFSSLAAATLGVSVIEVHLAMHKQAFGPDTVASLTPDEIKLMIEGVREIEAMNANPVEKDELAEEFSAMRGLFTKSVVVRRNLKKGDVLTLEDLIEKKPGTGIPAHRLPEFVGKKLKLALRADTFLEEKHVA